MGESKAGLSADQKRQILQKRLADQEALLEEYRLNLVLAQAAVDALRRELEV